MKWILIVIGALAILVALAYLIGYLLEVKHKATVERKLKASVDEVWLVLTNFKDYIRWRSGIKQLTVDGTDKWTEANSHGDKVSYQLEIVEEKRRLITRILNKDLPYGGYWEFEIIPAPDGCLVRITENGEVYNPLFRVMSKYIFGHDTMIKKYLTDLDAKVGGQK